MQRASLHTTSKSFFAQRPQRSQRYVELSAYSANSARDNILYEREIMPTKKKAKKRASDSGLQASGATRATSHTTGATTRATHTSSHISDAKSTHQNLASLETALTDIAAAITALASGEAQNAERRTQRAE